MNDTVIVYGVDVFKEIEKKDKLLKLYKELSKYVDEQTHAHELPKITRLKILIEDLENENNL